MYLEHYAIHHTTALEGNLCRSEMELWLGVAFQVMPTQVLTFAKYLHGALSNKIFSLCMTLTLTFCESVDYVSNLLSFIGELIVLCLKKLLILLFWSKTLSNFQWYVIKFVFFSFVCQHFKLFSNKFGKTFRRRNIMEDANKTYLQTCNFNQERDPFCPVFRIGDIVHFAGENFTQLAVRGGVIVISIDWNCNLDWDFLEFCKPIYSFRRVDDPNTNIAPGWNFRYEKQIDWIKDIKTPTATTNYSLDMQIITRRTGARYSNLMAFVLLLRSEGRVRNSTSFQPCWTLVLD